MRLSFHGAVEDVTGSCFLLETEGGKLLIDCGMHQGERMCARTNFEGYDFDPAHVSAVLVTHAHFDHTGRLPDIVQKGFAGKIYMTPPTRSLTEIILNDSVNVMEENAKRCGDDTLYGADQVRKMMQQIEPTGYHHEFSPIPGVKAMFHDAGHILGSAFITLDVTEGGTTERLVFSGDVGNDDVPILPDTEPIAHADVVICESTYGNRDHDEVAERGAKLAAFVKEIIAKKGTIIIPAFSIERTQELLYELNHLLEKKEIPAVPIYLDSPLAIRATAIYRHYKEYLRFEHPAMAGSDVDFFSFPTLRETLSTEESKEINEDKRPKIIIAGNGMMTGGRVMHHLTRYLNDDRAGVLIIGYQANYTLGRKIQDGATSVRIYGQDVPVRAKVQRIEAFSAHGDRKKLARWLKPEEGPVPRVFLVHGEDGTKQEFASYLRQQIGATVEIPRVTQIYELAKAHS